MRIITRARLALTLLLPLVFVASAQDSNAVWVIPIRGEITQATAQFVRSRIELANDAQPLALVFLINTPGGGLNPMREISDAIIQQAQLPTIAVVEDALSAGALIAMSAEQLAMLPGSVIGAATPINALTGQVADEKIVSASSGLFRSVAEGRGRNGNVAAAMVNPRIDIPGLSTSEELVTLTAAQAVEFDIADIQASSLNDALAQFGYPDVSIERLEPSFTERLAGGLTTPLIAALLLAVGLGGLIIEIFTPGFGVPGGVGAVALALLFGGAFIATPAGAFDVVLMLTGIVLIALEVLVIPGFGVAGVLGLAAIIFSVFRIFQDATPFVLGYATVIGGVLLGLAFWLLPNTRFASALTLSTRLTNTPDMPVGVGADPEGARRTGSRNDLVGARGVTLTDLRPSGVARLEGERIDVVSQGEFVNAGTDIEVFRVEGTRVVVRSLEV